MTTTATYTKLRTGEWGVRCAATHAVIGADITVTKKSGETKTERIRSVVWTDTTTALVAIEKTERPASRGSKWSRAPRARGICEDAPCCGCCGVGGEWGW